MVEPASHRRPMTVSKLALLPRSLERFNGAASHLSRQRFRSQAGYSREAVLFSALVLLLLLASFTAFVSRMYHKTFHVLSDQWFAKGEGSFRAGKAAEALNDYRNALAYSPSNSQFQFHLAQALAATGREEEAESYLLNLLSVSPGSGEINLELARIAARNSATSDALRYYHSAVYGGWENDPATMRWNARLELCEFILSHSGTRQAEAEITALADDVPPGNIDAHEKSGDLLLRVGLWTRALAEFQSVLAAGTSDADALAGAGTAAFHLNEFAQALEYFDRLPDDRRVGPQTTGLRITEMIAAAQQATAPNHGGAQR
jgi:tetratricopeptide (TPR) repeat protein